MRSNTTPIRLANVDNTNTFDKNSKLKTAGNVPSSNQNVARASSPSVPTSEHQGNESAIVFNHELPDFSEYSGRQAAPQVMQAYTIPNSQGVSVSNGYRPQAESEPILPSEAFVAKPLENDSIKNFKKTISNVASKTSSARDVVPLLMTLGVLVGAVSGLLGGLATGNPLIGVAAGLAVGFGLTAIGVIVAKAKQRKLRNDPEIQSFLQQFGQIKNDPILAESFKKDPDFKKAVKMEKFLTDSNFGATILKLGAKKMPQRSLMFMGRMFDI